MKFFTKFACLAVVSSAAFGQALPTFDIADVHASPHTVEPEMSGGVLRAGRYELRQANMVDLIRTAYGVDADKVLGGPSWLELDRFDVIAKTPPATTPETAKLMLQALLTDRFKLALHKDSHPLPGFVLSVGKGGNPKLKEADGSADSGCKYTTSPTPAEAAARRQASIQSGAPALLLPTYLYTCGNMTMAAFAEGMHTMLAAQTYFETGIIVDQTGLKGAWDFNFKYGPKIPANLSASLNVSGEAISIFDAVDKQLGLKLEAMKIPTPVIVVDSVNRKPSDNPPGVTTSLPVIPAEFEVADLRLSDPKAAPAQGAGFQPGGRVDLRNIALTNLINLAFSVNGTDALVGVPKSAAAVHLDLIAKMPSTGAGQAQGIAGIDIDFFRPALKALLIDRFKMAVHTEDRPVDAYTLVAAKPKLKKTADPLIRAGCKQGNAPATGGGVAGGLLIQVTCQNTTMAQFAEQLDAIASSYIHYPVLDSTAIDGAWDFSFTFSLIPPNLLATLGARAGAAADASQQGGAASDPIGGVTLFDAVEKQLGLKLELHKRPEPVVVIDHMEEKPADN
jgi:uncharacterized protein (TIGR03435 family)